MTDNLCPHAIFFKQARAHFLYGFLVPVQYICRGKLWFSATPDQIKKLFSVFEPLTNLTRSNLAGLYNLQHDAGCFDTCRLHLVLSLCFEYLKIERERFEMAVCTCLWEILEILASMLSYKVAIWSVEARRVYEIWNENTAALLFPNYFVRVPT